MGKINDIIHGRLDSLHIYLAKLDSKQNDYGVWEKQYVLGRMDLIQSEIDFLNLLSDELSLDELINLRNIDTNVA